MKRRTIFNLFFIGVVLSFFFTPLGYYTKIFLQRLLASSVIEIPRGAVSMNYQWRLKRANNEFFDFSEAKGSPAVVYFWASWSEKSIADLDAMVDLYHEFGKKVKFYFITNEEPASVALMMKKHEYDFPVAYLISENEPFPFDTREVPSGYLLDSQGWIRGKGSGVVRWTAPSVRRLLQEMIKEK